MFERALKFKVTNRSLRGLEKLFKINDPMTDLVLEKNDNKKHEWRIQFNCKNTNKQVKEKPQRPFLDD